MANAITFAVVDWTGASKPIYLMQDETMPTTIHGVFGGMPHDLTGCSASPNGTAVSSKTKIFFVDTSVKVTIAPSRISIVTISGDIGGNVDAGDCASLVSFVLACKLPPIAAA